MRENTKSTYYVRCKEQNKQTLYAISPGRTTEWTPDINEAHEYSDFGNATPFPGEWTERVEVHFKRETFKTKSYRKWD